MAESPSQTAAARPQSRLLTEAREAPQAVARMLAANSPLAAEIGARLRAAPPPFAVSCARGSSDAAATFARYLFEIRLGIVTASMGPSVRSIYAAEPRMTGALFLAISQSGQSPDLLHLAEAAREGGALTLAVVNDPGSPLAAACEMVLPLHAGPEKSVAATKSWLCSLAAVLQLVAAWAQDKKLAAALEALPEGLDRAAKADWSPAAERLARASSLYVVGRGIGLAAAQEAALKMKEVCGLHAEAISAAELMHGPLTLAGPDFPVMVFSQHDEAYQSVADLVSLLQARDVPVIAAGPTPGSIPGGGAMLPCDPSLSPLVTPIALVQSFYGLADTVARLRGRDPDHPPFLSKVTATL